MVIEIQFLLIQHNSGNGSRDEDISSFDQTFLPVSANMY